MSSVGDNSDDDDHSQGHTGGMIGGIILEQIETLTQDSPDQEPEVGSERWIIKKANEIYTNLGKGYPECVYHRAFEVELRDAGLQYESEKLVPIVYKNVQVGYGRADIVVKGETPMILEFKAIGGSVGIKELEQLGHYMRHLEVNVGIIINFSQPSINPRTSVDFIVGRVSD